MSVIESSRRYHFCMIKFPQPPVACKRIYDNSKKDDEIKNHHEEIEGETMSHGPKKNCDQADDVMALDNQEGGKEIHTESLLYTTMTKTAGPVDDHLLVPVARTREDEQVAIF